MPNAASRLSLYEMDVREGSQAAVRDGRSGDSGPSCRVVRVMPLGEGTKVGWYLVLMEGTDLHGTVSIWRVRVGCSKGILNKP